MDRGRPYWGHDRRSKAFEATAETWASMEFTLQQAHDPMSPPHNASVERSPWCEFPVHEALRTWYRDQIVQHDGRDFSGIEQAYEANKAFWKFNDASVGKLVIRDDGGRVIFSSTVNVYPAENNSFDIFLDDNSTFSGWYRDERARQRASLEKLQVWIEGLLAALEKVLDDREALQLLAEAQKTRIADLEQELEAVQTLLLSAQRISDQSSKSAWVASLGTILRDLIIAFGTNYAFRAMGSPELEEILRICTEIREAMHSPTVQQR